MEQPSAPQLILQAFFSPKSYYFIGHASGWAAFLVYVLIALVGVLNAFGTVRGWTEDFRTLALEHVDIPTMTFEDYTLTVDAEAPYTFLDISEDQFGEIFGNAGSETFSLYFAYDPELVHQDKMAEYDLVALLGPETVSVGGAQVPEGQTGEMTYRELEEQGNNPNGFPEGTITSQEFDEGVNIALTMGFWVASIMLAVWRLFAQLAITLIVAALGMIYSNKFIEPWGFGQMFKIAIFAMLPIAVIRFFILPAAISTPLVAGFFATILYVVWLFVCLNQADDPQMEPSPTASGPSTGSFSDGDYL